MCYVVLSQSIILAIYCYSFLSFPFLPDILSWLLVKIENEHVCKNNTASKGTSQLLILLSFQILGWSLTKYTYIFLLYPSCVVKGNTLSGTRKLTVFTIPRSKKSSSRSKCHHLRFVSNLVRETYASNFKDPSSRNMSAGQWRDGDLTIKALPGLQPQAPVALLPNRGRKLDLVQGCQRCWLDQQQWLPLRLWPELQPLPQASTSGRSGPDTPTPTPQPRARQREATAWEQTAVIKQESLPARLGVGGG